MSKEWKLVPVEPTEEMCEAYATNSIVPIGPISKHGYRAMLAAAPVPPQDLAQPAAYISASVLEHLISGGDAGWQWIGPAPYGSDQIPLFTRSDAGEVDRLNTVVEQQKSLIASLRSDLRDSYSIDAAVQEEHLDLEAAAKKLAACMDYPWEHMPEQGRASMREHATAVIGAALGSKQ